MTYEEFTKYAAGNKRVEGSYEPGRKTPFISDKTRLKGPSLETIYKDTSLDELEAQLRDFEANPNTNPDKLAAFKNYVTKRRADQIQPQKPLEGSWLDRNKDWLSGVGAGTAAGLTAYSLAELHPMLRRARFLRTLLGLGIGTGVGLGTSWLVGSK